ncbi:DUF1997 domain-containing protein [Synechococcus sp. PCC 6312]|uniref:DUF1997 domain-containing protein n=1 Tax=Synechococcus sp. (strain ATCC 27167 / PCC 6312) TaxID=195253 RepID=UPI00029EF084|nr:DUF1997 domain-containing protein [Synechococcus sp. PCC 6312]AFY61702.1 Protein of unknown function (DUF1997) [Synechococcus sp. PCC 6312]
MSTSEHPQAPETEMSPLEPLTFRTSFKGWMEMYAPVPEVEAYLDAHQGWFVRCAHPMQAEPIGQTGYILTIGRFGSFGYTVEPKIGLNLLPENDRVYRIQTIPVPDQPYLNYEVDFQAAMLLIPRSVDAHDQELLALNVRDYTHVTWDLELGVEIVFPRFIYHLPQRLLQSTGDRILAQIVKQVSHRLTAKVQDDFHNTLGLKLAKRPHRQRFHATHLPSPNGSAVAPLIDKLPPNPDL